MNNKMLLAVLIFLLVLALTSFIRFQPQGFSDSQDNANQEDASENSQTNSLDSEDDEDEFEDEDNSAIIPDNTPTPPTASNEKVTAQQLSLHNEKIDCWVSYKGKVYDVTSFLPKHPGSSRAIEPYCGTSSEFKEAFEGMHGTSQVKKLMQVGVLIGDFDVIGEMQ